MPETTSLRKESIPAGICPAGIGVGGRGGAGISNISG